MTIRTNNPDHGGNMGVDGYKDLGWINGGCVQKDDKYIGCENLNHKQRYYDNSFFINRDTDNITICDECKIYWHTDMSD